MYLYIASNEPRLSADFSAVDGVFKHNTDLDERASFFALAPDDPKFGLTLPSFADLHTQVEEMKAKGQKVKVLYFLRHAEGYHNSAEREIHDKEQWWTVEGIKDKYIDADLNAEGVEQSKLLSRRLGVAAELGLMVDGLITSPLRRAVRTAGIGFNFTEDRTSDMHPRFKELYKKKAVAEELSRETLGKLKCDKRMTSSELAKIFPWVDYSAITEQDELWTESHRETLQEKKERVNQFLQWLWRNEKVSHLDYVVVATHSGWINAALKELKVIPDESKWKPANAMMMGLLVRDSDDTS
eukprot:CAMPEP_0167756238 /NCGR_PEP_ID=MMETSP0110_2-20121227/9274_1 /TAXON_ID=629695 /ORGANISM="Gymnochlora sp., Strain CCMP2014" /LENGTH=297 /DNA_ID=CAMNT_0007642325 /DNA_START=62 /DNA_END=955 /DNA_ORIENTATION=-